ncbi:MAG: DEAD-box ATP-dependent RNA helicase CshE [Calditrichaeota bacterium]|nr:DEAD-box ATP-dependent RNA helicase CshE [Calditrichota bacterium]
MARRQTTKRRTRTGTQWSADPLTQFLERLRQHRKYGGEFVHHRRLEPAPARTQQLSPPLPEQLARAVRAAGIARLYSHQVEGIRLARERKNVVTVTPTASGKSLNYLLPILERLIAAPKSRALLLFPIKALAQDQLVKIQRLLADAGLAGKVRAAIYDGDTPRAERVKLRRNPPHLLLTNPDMINAGLLPYHNQWEALFANLSWVVIDELHNYKGVFGSHVLQVLRRLRRVAMFHRARPQFLAASATIANPGELAERLTGEPFVAVEENGAPRAERHVLFVNPTGSLYTSAVRLLNESVAAGLKTIVFTKARRITELIHTWTLQSNPELAGRISAYRSGYLPAERREIERSLLTGELDGVVATSALEMGIDIGGLDVAVLVGYPGSIASTWQRGGRVGRKDRPSAIFLLALPDALDQYWMRHPDDFFRRSAEAAVVDTANPYLLKAHLVAAAQETPLRADDPVYPHHQVAGAVSELVSEEKLLEAIEGRVWFAKESYPQRGIDIRGGGETFVIHEQGTGRLIGRVNGWQALAECHPGAVYLHRGRNWLVTHLDLGTREVVAEHTDVPWYTQARSEKDTKILEVYASREMSRYKVSLGKLEVTERVVGYEKRSTSGRDKISEHELDLPPVVYQTVGLWFEPPQSAIGGLIAHKYHPMGSLHATEHACLALLPLFALCDRNDLGGISFTRHAETGGAAVFLYDGHPGGLGLANRAYDVLDELFERMLELVRDCPCDDGCPSCVHSPKCGHGNQPLDKAGCVRLLEHLTGGRALAGDRSLAAAAFGSEGAAQTHSLARNGPANSRTPTEDDAMNAAKPDRPWENQLPYADGRDIVVFDLETQLAAHEVGGWGNIHLMRLAVGVVYQRATGDFHVFEESRAGELIDRLQRAELVVGFNNKRFDNAVLSAYTSADLRELKSLDLLEEIVTRHGFRVKLDQLAHATLGARKTADGLQALAWWKQGKIQQIIDYCKVDVDVTAKLFDYVLEHGYALLERNRRRARLPLEIRLSDVLSDPDLFSGLS